MLNVDWYPISLDFCCCLWSTNDCCVTAVTAKKSISLGFTRALRARAARGKGQGARGQGDKGTNIGFDCWPCRGVFLECDCDFAWYTSFITQQERNSLLSTHKYVEHVRKRLWMGNEIEGNGKWKWGNGKRKWLKKRSESEEMENESGWKREDESELSRKKESSKDPGAEKKHWN